jgi:hypothetical protein
LAVVAGTTCGMLAANVPVVFLGNAFAGRLPMRAIHYTTTVLLLATGETCDGIASATHRPIAVVHHRQQWFERDHSPTFPVKWNNRLGVAAGHGKPNSWCGIFHYLCQEFRQISLTLAESPHTSDTINEKPSINQK